jgi:2-hydroxy-3-keto-5-methylthiopentenyl-1-phosphate phosphatase
MIKRIYIILFALVLFSCNQRKEAEANTDFLYFDIKGYFAKEIFRLQKLKPIVNKTVSINGLTENKASRIADWQKELAIFVNADINKTSWKGSFKIGKENGADVYISDSKKIPIKKILVDQSALRVNKVEIIIDNKNILYQSQDTLTYYPDSLYTIKKQQKIRLLNEKKYLIVGKLK